MIQKNITQRIKHKALELLEQSRLGLRYSELRDKILQSDNSLKSNTVGANIWNLDALFPTIVYKPSKGLFRLLKYKPSEAGISESQQPPEKNITVKEQDFYTPFADWLQNEIEDVNKAIALGGKKFLDKWGTPDVIGKLESKRSDIIKGPTEIVSAEIKTDTAQLITAFGQACSYKLFSHKVYLVVPRDSPNDEISRLDSLCQIFGIGMVTFDLMSCHSPDFRIKVRPVRHEPDLFYTNKYMAIIEKDLFG